jgi:hypothetical protein
LIGSDGWSADQREKRTIWVEGKDPSRGNAGGGWKKGKKRGKMVEEEEGGGKADEVRKPKERGGGEKPTTLLLFLPHPSFHTYIQPISPLSLLFGLASAAAAVTPAEFLWTESD